MNQHNQSETGIIHIPVVIVILFVGVIAFTAGVAYRIQSNRQASQVVSTEGDDLREIKEVDIEDIIAVLPEQRKELEDNNEDKVEQTQPEPKPEQSAPKPADKPKEDSQQKNKTDTSLVKIQSISINSSGDNFVLTAQLPASYNGTCQALLKPLEGGTQNDHKVVSQSFSGNNCSVTVKKSSLNNQYSDWRTYMSFYSSDKTAKSHWTQADNVSL